MLDIFSTADSVVVAFVIVYGLFRLRRNPEVKAVATTAAVAVSAWYGVVLILALAGLFSSVRFPRSPLVPLSVVLPVVGGWLLMTRTEGGRRLSAALPLHWLVGVQFYRVIGIVFLGLYWTGRLPGEFALPAGFGDVFVGLAAPFVARFARLRRPGWERLVIAWNVVGLLDLTVAVGTGVMTSPGQAHVLALGHPNMLASAFPLVMIPAFGVPLAVLLHVLSIRATARHLQRGGKFVGVRAVRT